jgi:hypothetical protein
VYHFTAGLKAGSTLYPGRGHFSFDLALRLNGELGCFAAQALRTSSAIPKDSIPAGKLWANYQ